jgi:dephospho-CoA kinase
MLVLGITGGIGTGKSYIASCFKRLGFPVFDADACVHKLMEKDKKAIQAIERVFPEAVVDHRVVRAKLRHIVQKNKDALSKLEAILHPLVREEERRFLRKSRAMRKRLACLEIPLLFETGADALCDVVLVTHVPEYIQRQRVLKRPGMTEEFLAYIKTIQSSQREKCQKADLIIDTSKGKAYNFQYVKRIVKRLLEK